MNVQFSQRLWAEDIEDFISKGKTEEAEKIFVEEMKILPLYMKIAIFNRRIFERENSSIHHNVVYTKKDKYLEAKKKLKLFSL